MVKQDYPLVKFCWRHYKVRFTAYKGTSFKGDISIDDFRVGEAPNCPQPAFLNAFNIDPTSATLTWTPTGNESSWALYVVNSGSTLANTNPTIESNDTINVTGLSSSSSYSFYVQALCGADSSYISGTLIIFSLLVQVIPQLLIQKPLIMPLSPFVGATVTYKAMDGNILDPLVMELQAQPITLGMADPLHGLIFLELTKGLFLKALLLMFR